MIGIVFTAIVQKMLHTGFVKLPLGNMTFSVSPKLKYPLRVRIYTNMPTTQFLNEGFSMYPTPIQECMLPEHYNLLSSLREKAIEYKTQKNLEHDEV